MVFSAGLTLLASAIEPRLANLEARGQVAKTTRSANSAGVTTAETVVDSATITAKAGHRYKITWEGSYSISASGDNGELRLRFAAGASVTSAGTLIKGRIVQSSAANVAQSVTVTATTTALPAGQVTVGALIIRTAGAGTHTAAASPAWVAELIIEDMG